MEPMMKYGISTPPAKNPKDSLPFEYFLVPSGALRRFDTREALLEFMDAEDTEAATEPVIIAGLELKVVVGLDLKPLGDKV